MFNVQWEDPSEMTAYKVLTPGEAIFTVQQIIDTAKNGVSKLCSSRTGEEMIRVVFLVEDSTGKTSMVDQYIVASQPWKIKQICWAINKPEIYMEGKEHGDINTLKMVGHGGQCVIAIEKSTDPRYPDDKTVISKFIDAVKESESKIEQKTEQTVSQNAIPDDDVPF